MTEMGNLLMWIGTVYISMKTLILMDYADGLRNNWRSNERLDSNGNGQKSLISFLVYTEKNRMLNTKQVSMKMLKKSQLPKNVKSKAKCQHQKDPQVVASQPRPPGESKRNYR